MPLLTDRIFFETTMCRFFEQADALLNICCKKNMLHLQQYYANIVLLKMQVDY